MNLRERKASVNSTSYMLPIKFVKVGEHILVHLISAERLNLKYGSFRNSLTALPNSGGPDAIVHLTAWLKSNKNRYSDLPNIGFIFHISRCGSTLLTQNLKATERFIALGEPGFLGCLYSEYSIIPADLRTPVARCALTIWNQWAYSSDKQLICKLNSKAISQRRQIRGDFPDAKMLFLYREPTPVVESLVRKPSASIAHQYWSVLAREEQADRHQISLSTYAAKVYLYILLEMKAAILEGNLGCDYKYLSRDFSKIIDFFSDPRISELKVTSENRIGQSAWNDYWSAKEGEWQSTPYISISKSSMKTFYNDNLKLLEPLHTIFAQVSSMKLEQR